MIGVASGFSRTACAGLMLSAAVLAQPAPALRIVVIEGEDAVNVIQQKTAVRPVVEVRDRNDLPVPGVLVTFSIQGGNAASFGGASTLTIATNAAGQAAVTGFTPTAAGAVQIQVQAAFQGQIATATITQTNVLTAAQAAAASTAGTTGTASTSGTSGTAGTSGTLASGGGGGLSATTIGLVGAAVGGGALAATQLTQDQEEGDDLYTGSFTGQIVSESVGGGGAVRCTVTRSVVAEAKLTLEVNTAGSVRGFVEFTGTDTVVAQTCAGQVRTDRFTHGMDVTGVPSSFGGQASNSQTGPVDIDPRLTRQSTQEAVFQASISGDIVTATLTHSGRSVTTGGEGGVVNEMSSGTFPMTLRKSP